jgi:Tfp pilus assembly protein PilX
MKGKNQSSGSTLFIAIVVLVFLSVLGMSLIAFLFSRISYTELEADRLKALYLAEAGISMAIWELRYDLDVNGNGLGNIAVTTFGDGKFWARHNFQTSTITATGVVNGSRRTVQIKYTEI